ncbi:hypothetical protein NCCP1664_22060 [Zafaria cholistanensis]|uniref:Peptidase S8/S53 domain-containing protein n=1 Tax=Zafaria cholistanensis TaxID=1682741 RepID=A0A5A7NUX6_9MICC|nr:S8 family serine peptidase [Zafaria cholistanensis]GER23711.1 hypothetical protein NCCP1664_22060 [Zafaria cholistanensis]
MRPTAPLCARTAVVGAALAAVLALGTVLAAAPAARADAVRDEQYWLESSGIEKAWAETKGAGVTVAVIDTGIDAQHPDLHGQVVGGTDVSGAGEKDGTGPIGALPEHGTLVATLLAGHGNNGEAIARAEAENDVQRNAWERAAAEARASGRPVPPKPDTVKVPDPGPGPDGIVGVAPEADLLAVSLWLGSANPGGVSVQDQVPRAVRWAVDHGASVINMSLGSTTPEWPASWDSAFLYAEQKDVVVVAAAGNRAGGMVQVGAPATIPGVLTVAGVDKDGNASWDSSTTGISIGVAAPAEPLVGGLPEGGYASWSGTSGAAPLVAGVAALIRAKYPDMPARDVINRILVTARDAGDPGVDNLYGHGLLDAHAALTADVPAVAASPMDTIAEWIRVHRRGSAASSSAAAVPSAESTVPVAQAPAAVPPGPPGGALPGAVLAGFGILFAATVAGGTVHLVRTGRRERSLRAAEATVAELVVAAPSRRHDVFDDLPEA